MTDKTLVSDERLAELIASHQLQAADYRTRDDLAPLTHGETEAAYRNADILTALRELQSSRAPLASQAAEIEGLKAEVQRLQDLHLKRTNLTTQAFNERDEARAKLAAAEKLLRELRVFFADRSNAAYAIDAALPGEGDRNATGS